VITIAFWNIHKNGRVLPNLACLATAYAVDILLLAEPPTNLTPAVRALNKLKTGIWREETNGGSKVRALTRLGAADFTHRFTGIAGDVAGWILRAPKVLPAGEVLLAVVHLSSKFGGLNDADQAMIAGEAVSEINEAEDKIRHRNTAVVGDFNMYPYDSGMTSLTGFHALMTEQLAGQTDRVYRGRPRRRFYNPMWGLLGDRTPGPAGSFRWRSNVPHNPHWGMLDQLLLRGELIAFVRDLAVLEQDGAHAIVNADGFPNWDDFSDHLPVLFRIDT